MSNSARCLSPEPIWSTGQHLLATNQLPLADRSGLHTSAPGLDQSESPGAPTAGKMPYDPAPLEPWSAPLEPWSARLSGLDCLPYRKLAEDVQVTIASTVRQLAERELAQGHQYDYDGLAELLWLYDESRRVLCGALDRSWLDALLEAVKQGDAMAVRQLLADPVPSESGHEGEAVAGTPAALGTEVAVRVLLQAGHGKDRTPPLYLASKLGHTEVVRVLLEAGSSAEATLEDGSTPLFIAAQHGHEGAATEILLSADGGGGGDSKTWPRKDGATPLSIAAQYGHTSVVRVLLRFGADEEAAREDGATPLFVASQQGHLEVVRALLRAEADVDTRRQDGATPAYIAAQWGHCDILRELMQHGADAHAVTEDGATPLYAAAKNGHTEAMRLLLQRGGEATGDVGAVAKDGTTPLWIAAQNGHVDAVRLLLGEPGTHLEARRKRDRATSLFIAAQNGHTEVVSELLAAGANREAPRRGLAVRTPYTIAVKNGHTEVARLLLLEEPRGRR